MAFLLKPMKIFWMLILSLFFVVAFADGKDCGCTSVKSKETTREGGNMWLVSQEEGTFKSIAGKVQDLSGADMESALVEVFDKPDYLLCEYVPNNPNNCTTKSPETQRRKAACRTGKDGAFCFKKLKAGKYELRISKGVEWNVFHTVVAVNPKDVDAKDGGIEIIMSVGG